MKGLQKGRDISLYCFIIIFSIFTIATTSIGIECYNSNQQFKDEKQGNNRLSYYIGVMPARISTFGFNPKINNFSFLVCNLVCAIFAILSLTFMIYGRTKMPY